MKSTDELIGEIRGLSRGRISEKELEVVLDEVCAHLDATIQARMELGQSETAAAAEAIESFGNLNDFVSRVSKQHDAVSHTWFDERVWIAVMVMVALVAQSTFRTDHYLPYVDFGIPTLLCALAIFAFSWRPKRPQLFPCIAAFLLAIPLLAISLSVDDLSDSAFSARYSRADAMQQLSTNKAKLAGIAKVESAYKFAQVKYGDQSAEEGPPVRLTAVDRYGFDVRFRVEPAKSRFQGEHESLQFLSMLLQDTAREKHPALENVAVLNQRLHRSFWTNAACHVPIATSFSFTWAGIMALISLCAWLISGLHSVARIQRSTTGGIA